jgi:DNA-binding transcriptional LysR family regulator
MHIDFLGIQAFLAIVETGSFQLAATQLNLSQTAVSHRMRKLEEALGVRLIDRTTRDVTLSEAGRALLPNARSAVRELGMSCEAVRQHGQNANHWLAFACLPTLCTNLVSPLLRAASDAWPDTLVRVFDTSIREIVEVVTSRVASFGLTVVQPGYGDLVMQPVAVEPFVLICPPDHPLAVNPGVDCAVLEGEPLIRISLPSGNSMLVEEALGPLRDRLHWRYEALHNAMAIEMVRAGLGLTIVPSLSVPHGAGVGVVRIEAPRMCRELCLLTRRDDAPSEQESWMRDRAIGWLRQQLSDGQDDSAAWVAPNDSFVPAPRAP